MTAVGCGRVGSLDDALGLTGAQQSANRFLLRDRQADHLYGAYAGLKCTPSNYGATRLVIS